LPVLIPNQFVINSHPFAESLIHWYSGAKRDLPWRKTRDPYMVWVSEIILQQTRVEQGLPYFRRFVAAFPTVQQLADAREDHVLAIWQGLGYYSRARNMQAAARQVMTDFAGKFPTTYSDILRLKGVGPYTAAAIASICFHEPHPVVDGNVFRAASRLFGIRADISKASSRAVFVDTLLSVIDEKQPGTFNQAMMELGSAICQPTPKCTECPVLAFCYAFEKKMTHKLPVKGKKLKIKERHLHYLVLTDNTRVLMRKREGKDIWLGIYDFPNVEADEIESVWLDKSTHISDTYIHLLSHQKLHVRFYQVPTSAAKLKEFARTYQAKSYSLKQILTLPKPILVANYVNDMFVTVKHAND